MGKRKSGRAKSTYAFKKYLSELDYRSRRGPDYGAGCNDIADMLRAGQKVESYRVEHEKDGEIKVIGKADPA